MKKTLIFLIYALLGLLFFAATAFAQNVNVSEQDLIVSLGNGFNYKILSDTAFGSLVVNGGSITITRGDASYVIVRSFDKHELSNNGDATVECLPESGATFSQITITGSSAVTVSPIAINYCALTTTPPATGGGGGGRVQPVGGGVLGSIDQRLVAVERTDFPTDIENDDKILPLIEEVTAMMVDAKTYKVPKNKEFKRTYSLTWTYLSQVALSLKGLPCEDDVISGPTCRSAAKEANLIPSVLKKKVPTRIDIYETILKALEYDTDKARAQRNTLSFLCRDYSNIQLRQRDESMNTSEKIAYGAIIKSARINRFSSRFKSKRCYLDKAMRRQEFINVAATALKIKNKSLTPISRSSRRGS